MTYDTFGLTSLHEFLGDCVIYRSLVPADPRLPTLDELREPLQLEGNLLPRKAEPAYGRVVAEMLQRARALDRPGMAVQRLIYIGDTRMNDGTAFHNMRAAGDWPGWAFIGREEASSPPQFELEGSLYLANRWSLLPQFLQFLEDQDFGMDEGTALVIDVDKTAIGARGRNDRVIDEARVEGVKRTVAHLLGPRYDEVAFRAAYDELNQPAYHPFTSDNQDYLAYVCLMLGAGLYELDALVREIASGTMQHFIQFLEQVHERSGEVEAAGLAPVHEEVARSVRAGDPTPFKAFRHNEYLTTVARFGDLPGMDTVKALALRIAITQEVRAVALALRTRGVLVFGVSDKPDEASLPNQAQAAAGMKPLHRMDTLAIGEA